MPNETSLDALLPPGIARKAEDVGVTKARMDALPLILLGVLAGAFIGLGALFATIATTDPTKMLPWGVGRAIAGLVFSTGLGLVLVSGAELFTGNALLVLAWASRRIRTTEVLRNWALVLLGNAAGAFGTALLVFLARTWLLAQGAVGRSLLDLALLKCTLLPVEALARGILCNSLVCLAVWMSWSARTTADRLAAVVAPIACFVAAGFEHSIANLFVVPLALLLKAHAPAEFWIGIDRMATDYQALTPGSFLLSNLLPVTVGNAIGGSILVGGMYWLIYVRPRPLPAARSPAFQELEE
jgi:formate/nitrite transporter